VRIISRAGFFFVLFATAWLQVAPCAFAQNPQDMMPAESAAKAKEILQQAIQALGGTAYLNLHDATCEGRLSQFGHAGELNGFEKFADYTIPPFKDRTENLPKRNIITVMDGDKGWTLDRGGVSDASGADIARFQEDTKKDLDYILRTRIKEPNMVFRYAGQDIVDLKEADWVELVDSDNRTIKIAFAQATHLPLRKIVDTRDSNTRMKTDELEYYSNYHPINGIQTAFQFTRERNHIKVYQVFFDKCEYNTNLPDSLFSKQSLDERWEKVGKSARKKAEKDAKNN
jgi:hypothetical protein